MGSLYGFKYKFYTPLFSMQLFLIWEPDSVLTLSFEWDRFEIQLDSQWPKRYYRRPRKSELNLICYSVIRSRRPGLYTVGSELDQTANGSTVVQKNRLGVAIQLRFQVGPRRKWNWIIGHTQESLSVYWMRWTISFRPALRPCVTPSSSLAAGPHSPRPPLLHPLPRQPLMPCQYQVTTVN